MAKDGTVLAYLSETTLNKTFHLPEPKDMVYISIEGAKSTYDDDPDACAKIIDKFWLKKSRGGRSRWPDKLHRIEFNDEFRDFITLLHRLIGAPEAS